MLFSNQEARALEATKCVYDTEYGTSAQPAASRLGLLLELHRGQQVKPTRIQQACPSETPLADTVIQSHIQGRRAVVHRAPCLADTVTDTGLAGRRASCILPG